MLTSKRLTASLLALSASALLGACGDDDGGNNPDARPVDGSTAPDANTTPDAAPAPATRAATIAVTEVKLLSNDATTTGQAIGGAAITVSFEDLSTDTGTEVLNTGTPGCSVTTYTCTGTPDTCGFGTPIDAGAVTISNADQANPAILGAVPGPCTFIAGSGTTPGAYRCPVTQLAGVGGDLNITAQSGTLTVAGQTFASNLRGTFVGITGATGAGAAFNGKALPVVQVVNATTLAVAAPGVAAFNAELTGATLTFFQGVGPVPGGGAPGAAAIDFLSDGAPATEEVRVQWTPPANAMLPAVDMKVKPAGQGFVLDDDCAGCITPTTFPTSAGTDANAKFTITCPTGMCGTTGGGTGPGAILDAIAVSGSASNGVTTGIAPFEMPKTGVTKFVSFSCSNLGTKLEIPQPVIKAILDIGPSRVETRALRISAPLPLKDTANPANEVRVVVGHGFVGHTDIPAPTAN
jgi:hypothetical protein